MTIVVFELGPSVLAAGGPECVAIDGWAVLGVAALLTAPRLVREYLSSEKG